MWIANTSIARPVFATMVIASLVVLGLVSLTRIGIDLFPEVNFPFVNVTVVYPGAAPEEVETLVTRPIEDAVAGINGVKRVISTSTEGVARVGIELRLEVDPQAAAAEVREKVAAARSRLPSDIEDPTIARFDVAALPIMVYAVGSPQPSHVTRRQVEDAIKPQLERIDGVAAVEVNGGRVREIQVEIDPRRLEALQLPLAAVVERLAAENLDVPGGLLRRGGRSVALRTKGELRDVDEIADVVLRSDGGSTVRVRDVARVVDGFADRTSTTRLNGTEAVSFAVRKQSGANTAAVASRVEAAVAALMPRLPQLDIRPVHNDADFIRENVREVRTHIVAGGLMAVLVVFLFMRDWRSTVITALALPTSVIATFFFMYVAGFTFNMMTLMGLSLVIGILIDDAVVVRENIYRHLEMGRDPFAAAREGTAEIGLAVMATTCTILAVFLPVGFMTGLVGQFFTSFALTIAFAVSVSLLVAFTLDPMLSSRFVRHVPPEQQRRSRVGRVLVRWGEFYDRVDHRYQRVLSWALARPVAVVAAAVAIFLASLSTLAIMGTEFVPAEDRGQYDVLVELPPGTAFERSVEEVATLEREVLAIPEVRQVFATVGLDGDPRRARLQVKTVHKRERARGLREIKDETRRRLARVAGLRATVADPEFMQGVPNEAPITVYLRGHDLDALQRLSAEIVARVQRVPGTVDVDSSLERGQPQLVARVNRAIAADLGFDVGLVARQLRGMVDGIVATRLRDGDAQHDVRVRLAPEFRNDPETLARAPLHAPSGTLVRTGDVVRFESGAGPTSIDREQRQRQVRIGIELDGRSLGDVTRDVERAIAGVAMPAGIEWGFAGDVELMEESAAAMALALVLAVAFIYIVLASQFESFTEPLLIMLSLPLAVVGALLALLVTGNNLGMPAMIGIVMLMGLVTKNAILLVDVANQHVRRGLAVEEALLRAGPMRLRPILMTTLAMILGMLPSAIGRGDGSEFRSPISIATIGGLITSTLLTLVVVPVAYLLLARVQARLRAWRAVAPGARPARTARVTGALLIAGLPVGLVPGASAAAQPALPASRPHAVAAAAPAPLVLTFDEALARALAANAAILAAEEEARAAHARVADARTAFLPTADLTYLYTPVQRFPLIQIPGGVFGPDPLTFEAGFTRRNIVHIEASQPLFTGGRLAAAYAAQATAARAADLELARARQALRLQVVEAFHAVLLHQQGVRVADEGVVLAERQLALARARFDAGTVARLDVLRAEVDLANARARRVQAAAAVDTAVQALRTLLALPQSQPLELRGSLDVPIELPGRDALGAALAQRPDVQALAARRELAALTARLADAERKPSLALTGSLQYQEDGLAHLWQPDNQSYAIGVAVRVPLLGAPRAAAKRAVAEAQRRQADHGQRAALDAGQLDIERAWTDLLASEEMVAVHERAVALARESVAVAEVSYENGIITAAELTDAQVALLQTESLLLQARYQRIVAAARARFAAGLD